MKRSFIYITVFLIFTGIRLSAQEAGELRSVNHDGVHSGPCISKAEMDEIKKRIALSKIQLEAEGKLESNRVAAFGAHSFRWPVARAAHNYNLDFSYISNYVDNNAVSVGANTVEDYNCGTRSYDNDDGYDHQGIDIGIGPFPWTMMDNDDVDVVAAEDGYIADKRDGNNDRNCEWDTAFAQPVNSVSLTHSDGSSTLYLHLKDGSLTSKPEGAYVKRGEYLGKVGSSGRSTGPHLHFEVHDDLGNVRDPFQNGNCNTGNNGSLWADEQPYYNRQIVSVFTLSAPWTDATCNTAGGSHATSGIVPYRNHFSAGEMIWLSASVRDITATQVVQLRVRNSAGVQLYSHSYTYTGTHRELLTLSPVFFVAPTAQGNYKLECTFNGVTRSHYFTVGCPGSITLASTRSSNYGFISGGTITSTDVISSGARNVQYQAETYIELKTGFVATNGCEFIARVANCTVGGVRNEEDLTQEENGNPEVTVMPNPFTDHATIEIILANDDVMDVVIVDIAGRLVQTVADDNKAAAGSHTFSINAHDFRPGIYQCIVVTESGSRTVHKISIVR